MSKCRCGRACLVAKRQIFVDEFFMELVKIDGGITTINIDDRLIIFIKAFFFF